MVTDLEYAKNQLENAIAFDRSNLSRTSVRDCAQRALDAVERALEEARQLAKVSEDN